MLRTISSPFTFLCKVAFPTVWIGGFGAAALALFLKVPVSDGHGGVLDSELAKWKVLGLMLLGSSFLYWQFIRLKKVVLSDDSFIISNYWKKIVVPFSELENITENRWSSVHPVTLHFGQKTAFGSKVTFMPHTRAFSFWSSHPIVQELRDLRALVMQGRSALR